MNKQKIERVISIRLVVKKYKWIAIAKMPVNPKKVTSEFVILTEDLRLTLGTIKWFGRWRQYAYFPNSDTVYEKQCLKDISSFLDELMQERSQQKQSSKDSSPTMLGNGGKL